MLHLATLKPLPQIIIFARSLSFIVGGGVILLAGASFLFSQDVPAIFTNLDRMFGSAFVVFYAALLSLSLYATHQISMRGKNRALWHEVGQHAASGIATLALTFTLLGISLGIGMLAQKQLTPETVPAIISGLTLHFSKAFMTTVVGLPTAAILRAIIDIRYRKITGASPLK